MPGRAPLLMAPPNPEPPAPGCTPPHLELVAAGGDAQIRASCPIV